MDNNKFVETTEPPHTVSSGQTKLNALTIRLTVYLHFERLN